MVNAVSKLSSSSRWSGMVALDDTALAVTDTGGSGTPVVYLNGQFAAQGCWRRVVAELSGEYRHITYDMRARGRSKRSSDNSFEAHLRDLDAVLEARDIEQPLLVGWSYGAAVAVCRAARNPSRVRGVVSVDGAYPYAEPVDAIARHIRRLFRRLRWLLPLIRPFGLSARMSAEEHAESNIELMRVLSGLAPVLDGLTCPVRYVVATGGHIGASSAQMERLRAALDPVLSRNPNVRVSAKIASNHAQVLRKDFRAVAAAVREFPVVRGEQRR